MKGGGGGGGMQKCKMCIKSQFFCFGLVCLFAAFGVGGGWGGGQQQDNPTRL